MPTFRLHTAARASGGLWWTHRRMWARPLGPALAGLGVGALLALGPVVALRPLAGLVALGVLAWSLRRAVAVPTGAILVAAEAMAGRTVTARELDARLRWPIPRFPPAALAALLVWGVLMSAAAAAGQALAAGWSDPTASRLDLALDVGLLLAILTVTVGTLHGLVGVVVDPAPALAALRTTWRLTHDCRRRAFLVEGLATGALLGAIVTASLGTTAGLRALGATDDAAAGLGAALASLLGCAGLPLWFLFVTHHYLACRATDAALRLRPVAVAAALEAVNG